MIRGVLNWLWRPKEEEVALDDAFNALNTQEQDVVIEEKKNEVVPEVPYTCSLRTGVITKAEDIDFEIDNKFNFKSELEGLKVGAKVSYIVRNEHGEVKVTNVTIVHNEWDNGVEQTGDTLWENRTLVTKVVSRVERVLKCQPGDCSIDLNVVAAAFVPEVGDWLELGVKAVINPNVTDCFGGIIEINRVCPLRTSKVCGKIRQYFADSQTGIINKDIFFSIDVTPMGYFPSIGDNVTCEIIESEQHSCNWRALKIVVDDALTNIHGEDEVIVERKDGRGNSSINEDKDVHITKDLAVKFSAFNEQSFLNITILNRKSEKIILHKYVCRNSNANIRLGHPRFIKDYVIKSNEAVTLKFTVRPKSVGSTKEQIHFYFAGFTAKRFINVVLEIPTNKLQERQFKRKKISPLPFNVRDGSARIIHGQRSGPPVRFVGRKIGDYPLPYGIWNLFQSVACNYSNAEFRKKLEDMKPVLCNELAYERYEDFFHTLLFIEEAYIKLAIRNYDQDRANFVRNGDYLMLEIENLAEKRPSLTTGDLLFAKDLNNPDLIYEGYIHKVGAKHIYVKFSQIVHAQYKGEDFQITLEPSRSRFRRMHHAVNSVMRTLGRDILFPKQVVPKKPQIEFTYDPYEDELGKKIDEMKTPSIPPPTKNGVIGNGDSSNINGLPNGKLKPNKCSVKAINKALADLNKENLPKLQWFDKNLNYYQREAVRNILLGEARPLPYIIFGPPGTGKTMTIVEAILQVVKMIPSSRLLVCTPSNSAANLIARRLINSGVIQPGDLVRLVAYRCIVDDLIPADLVPYTAVSTIHHYESIPDDETFLENGMKLGYTSKAIGRHRITVSTCNVAGCLNIMGFPEGHFSHFFIDEAGQVIEPEIMLPFSIVDSSNTQIILAGDPMQLDPIVQSVSEKYGLSESYLERLSIRFPYAKDLKGFPNTRGYDQRLITRLVYNYRSLPELLVMPNKLFYDNELKATVSETDSEEAKLFKKISELLPSVENRSPSSLLFHGIVGTNYQSETNPSWFNPDEVAQVFYYLNYLYKLGLTSDDIGIISPYVQQVKQIREIINSGNLEMPKVGSVEDFQGEERKVIILSTVRSVTQFMDHDKRFSIGFIGHSKRINVALTRAQVLNIIVGNPNILSSDNSWRSIINYCLAKGSYRGCEYVPFKR